MAIKNETNQLSFDDLEFEAEYVGEKEYFTITGKEQQYEPMVDCSAKRICNHATAQCSMRYDEKQRMKVEMNNFDLYILT